jgi:hypothetical protein
VDGRASDERESLEGANYMSIIGLILVIILLVILFRALGLA